MPAERVKRVPHPGTQSKDASVYPFRVVPIDYDPNIHRKLSKSDFASPVLFWEWKIQMAERKLARVKKARDKAEQVRASKNGSLRGYGFEIHQRDGFHCQYCGWDGSKWPNWLYLTVDHLLPRGHPNRKSPEFKVTACCFCNFADNQYFKRHGLCFEGKLRKELVEQRRPFVMRFRERYEAFFKDNVRGRT